MVDIISADDERIEESTYLDDSGNEKQVKPYMKAILKIIFFIIPTYFFNEVS